jgi:hypothetical protein
MKVRLAWSDGLMVSVVMVSVVIVPLSVRLGFGFVSLDVSVWILRAFAYRRSPVLEHRSVSV